MVVISFSLLREHQAAPCATDAVSLTSSAVVQPAVKLFFFAILQHKQEITCKCDNTQRRPII